MCWKLVCGEACPLTALNGADRGKSPIQFRFKYLCLFTFKQCHLCASRQTVFGDWKADLPRSPVVATAGDALVLCLDGLAFKELSIKVKLRHAKVREY